MASEIYLGTSTVTSSFFGDISSLAPDDETIYEQSILDADLATINMIPPSPDLKNFFYLILQYVGVTIPFPVIPTIGNQILILNFDGTQGETIYNEEVSNLIPVSNQNCQIDNTWKKFGTGSLSVISTEDPGYIYYEIYPILQNFTLHYFGILNTAEFSNIACGGGLLKMGETGYEGVIAANAIGNTYAELGSVIGYTEQPLPAFTLAIVSSDPAAGEYFVDSLTVGEEYHFAIVVKDLDIMVFINGIKKLTVSVETPILNFNMIAISEFNSNSDAIEITKEVLWENNFTPPTSAPECDDIYKIASNYSLLNVSGYDFGNVNITGTCSIQSYSDNVTSPSINNLTFSNISLETKKYYYLEGLFKESYPLILNDSFSMSIGDNKLLLQANYLYKTTGKVEVNKTKLIDSEASGGAEFNASISRSNIDGGGNVGWIFGAENTFIPKIVMIF